MRIHRPRFPALLITLPAILFAVTLGAQNGDQLAAGLAENARLLHQYTFKQRIEIAYKGEDRTSRVIQVRFDSNGKRQFTVVSESGGGEEPKGLGARIIARKRNEMKEYAQRLTDLVEQYLPPDAEKLRPALASAERGRAEKGISMTMKNYYQQGDSFSVVFNVAARKPQSMEIKTALDKDPIVINADFEDVSSGPSYPTLVKIQAPKKELEIRLTAYDFKKL
jgi:hypothetical protein